MTAIRQYLSDQQLVEERIFQQAERMLQYFEDQKGNDFDPALILMESVANVICRITFGKYFDSSHPDFQELLQLNIKGYTDSETNAQNFVLDFFPVAKYLPFRNYQSVQKLMRRIFEILRHQLKIQEKDFDPTAKIDNLTGSLLKERIAAEKEVGVEDKASILSDVYIINTLEDMFGAGYETTSTTLRRTIAYLVHRRECKQRYRTS